MSGTEKAELERRIARAVEEADAAEERAQAYREAGYDRAAQREFTLRESLDRRVISLMQCLPPADRRMWA